MRKWVVLLLALLLAIVPMALAEGLDIEEEPVLPEEDAVYSEAVDNAVAEEDFMLFSDEPVDKGYADFLTEGEENEGDIPIDAAHFPDEVFRSYIRESFDDGDGVLSEAECRNVTSIDVRWRGIGSLKGIEVFSNLEDLLCEGTGLTSLDVSGNTTLVTLYCGCNQLTSLDVSECKALTRFDCTANQLTSLCVSGCTALTNLSCSFNQLTSLDVSGCTALVGIGIDENPLTSLDVSGCTSLTVLECSYNKLTNLNMSGCTALTWLDWSNDVLISLDASGCTALKTLYCGENQLTNLNVSGCTALTWLNCSYNQLTSLDVSGCTALVNFIFNENPLTSLNVSGCTALTVLECGENQLTSLDVSGCTALSSLYCSVNQLTSLDVSECTALEYLWCGCNQLTNLDVSHNPYLNSLSCEGNRLTSLDMSHNRDLNSLSCEGNQLTSLDLSSSQLLFLDCHDNRIPSLDLSVCGAALKKALLNNPKFKTYDSGILYIRKEKSYELMFDDATTLIVNGKIVYGTGKISDCKITIKDKTYTGKALKPTPTVKYSGATLVKGTDYTVKYSNNTKVGTATMTVKGKGSYKGSKKAHFKIKPKTTAFTEVTGGEKKVTLKWNPQAEQVSGYQIQYGTKKDFSGAKKLTVKGATMVKKTIKDLKAKKTYYVRIRTYKTVNGKKYYSSWSKYKKIKTK